MLTCRVAKEEERNELKLANEESNYKNNDNSSYTEAHLSNEENFLYDLLRSATHNNDRLMYIYVFTAIVITTVIITLIRSFIFFNVSVQSASNQSSKIMYIYLNEIFHFTVGHESVAKFTQHNVPRCYTCTHVLFPHKSIGTNFESIFKGYGPSG